MINLTRFTKETRQILPIVDGWGQIQSRKFTCRCSDGWYLATIGNEVKIERKATQLEIYKTLKDRKTYQVYALGKEGIPVNFDGFKRRGWSESIKVNFLDLPIFSIASIICWDDKRYYFYQESIGKSNRIIQEVKRAFEGGLDLSKVRGVTPEIRYYYILSNLQRESVRFVADLSRFAISESERNKRINDFQRSFVGSLVRVITESGATYKRHTKRGDGYLVEWEINGSTIKSIIHDDLRILDAGFCLSGDDELHTMNSIIHLARLFQEESFLNITRG